MTVPILELLLRGPIDQQPNWIYKNLIALINFDITFDVIFQNLT